MYGSDLEMILGGWIMYDSVWFLLGGVQRSFDKIEQCNFRIVLIVDQKSNNAGNKSGKGILLSLCGPLGIA